jgi:hypothetical protein
MAAGCAAAMLHVGRCLSRCIITLDYRLQRSCCASHSRVAPVARGRAARSASSRTSRSTASRARCLRTYLPCTRTHTHAQAPARAHTPRELCTRWLCTHARAFTQLLHTRARKLHAHTNYTHANKPLPFRARSYPIVSAMSCAWFASVSADLAAVGADPGLRRAHFHFAHYETVRPGDSRVLCAGGCGPGTAQVRRKYS